MTLQCGPRHYNLCSVVLDTTTNALIAASDNSDGNVCGSIDGNVCGSIDGNICGSIDGNAYCLFIESCFTIPVFLYEIITFFPASMIPPSFTGRLQTREVKEGASVEFKVQVSGHPPPSIVWLREGCEIISSPDFEISCNGDVHSLYIPEVFYEDSGKFSVQAENAAGQNSCTAELIVEGNSTLVVITIILF